MNDFNHQGNPSSNTRKSSDEKAIKRWNKKLADLPLQCRQSVDQAQVKNLALKKNYQTGTRIGRENARTT
jgi:hypothetical protein